MTNLNELVSLLEQADFLGEQLKAARELQKRAEENEITISVIGQFKRGKSSLINAILGEDLLPVDIIPLTTAVTELRYSETFRACVSFTDGSQQEISRDQLEDYCSEQKNTGNHKHVSAVKVWTPTQPFGEGIVLVDTPGVGSVHQHNTESSYEYLEKSDAIIFLLSVDSPVSETERDFLLKARAYAAKFYFAVNKADTISEKDLATFLAFCSGVISDSMETPVSLYAVSAKTGQGIPELLEKLSGELQISRGSLLETSVQKKLLLIKEQARAKISLAVQAASLPQEELAEKLRKIEEKQKELAGFSEEVQVLSHHRTHVLVNGIQEKFDAVCPHLQEEMRQEAERLYKEHGDLPPKEFESCFQSELDRFLKERLGALNEEGIAMLKSGYEEIVTLLNQKASQSARFIASLLNQEFGLEYPVSEVSVQVSEHSDFFLRLGSAGSLLLDTDAFSHFLPKKTANKRFVSHSIKQAEDDISCNKNNMIYNYRYKMQESLRGMCNELSESVDSMAKEIQTLLSHVQNTFTSTSAQCREEKEKLLEILKKL